MKKFVIPLILIFLLSLCLFGCNRIDYNPRLIDFKLNEDYQNSVITYGSYYENPNYVESSYEDRTIFADQNSPKFIMEVIDNELKQQSIFKEIEKIDYSKEIVIVYAYTSIYPRKHILTRVALNDGVLEIDFKYASNNGRNDCCTPNTRFLVIKMDKVNYKSIKVCGDV